MRTKKQNRNSLTVTVTLPPETIEWMEKRIEACDSRSEYVRRLIEHDRTNNTLQDSFRMDADRLATATAA